MSDTAACAAGRRWLPEWRLLVGPFRRLVEGQALGQAADGFAQIAFAQVVVFELAGGASPAELARLLAATLLPFSLVGPVAGVIIDRWDRRRVLLVASMARAALVLLAMSVLVVRSRPLAYLGIILLLSLSRFVLAAKGAGLPRTVARAEDLVDANSLSSLAGLVAAFLGAVVGSTFVAAAPVAGFVAASAGYLVAAQRFAGLPPIGGGGAGPSVREGLRRLAADFAGGIGLIVREPDVRRPILAVWGHRLLLGGGFVVLVLIADIRYGMEAPGYGLALAVIGVGAFLGTVSAPAAAARVRPVALLPAAYLAAGAVAVVCGFWPDLVPLVVGVGVVAVAFQVLKVVADALVQRATPDAFRGRVFAVYDMLYNTAFVLAALAMVPLWDAGREQRLLWGLAVAFVLGGLVLARSTRSWPWVSPGGARPPRRPRRWLARLGALLAGMLPVLAFPEPGLWWLAFVGLVPLLLLVQHAPTASAAAWRAWWGGLGYFTVTYHWLVPTTGPFVLALGALLALSWVPWGVVAHAARRSRHPVAFSMLLVPAAWVAGEFLRSWESLGGPWGLLGASQTNDLPILRVAAAGGVWAVSAVVVAVNVAVALVIPPALVRRFTPAAAVPAVPLRGRAAAITVGAAAVATALVVGARCVPPVSDDAPVVRVGGVQVGTGYAYAERFDAHEAGTRALVAQQPDLVVWGESSIGFDLDSHPEYLARLTELAAEVGAPLLVNVDARQEGGGIRKTAVLVGADGVLGSYDKMRLVPFGEYVPFHRLIGWVRRFSQAAEENRGRGEALAILDADGLRLGPLVCFESTFPDLSRELARLDADVVIVQAATTTFQDSWAPEQHASLAVVRAVESGRPVVHATLTGQTTVVDRTGARLVVLGTDRREAWLTPVAIDPRATPYVRFGDWVPAAAIALLVAAAIARGLSAARLDSRGGQGPVPVGSTSSQRIAVLDEGGHATDGGVMSDARIEVDRAIAAEPTAIFEVLRRPDGHVAIDASGMLMWAEGEPVTAVGDRFTVHMDRDSLRDFPLGEYEVTVVISVFEPDREIAWTIDGALQPPIGHVYGYRLDPIDGGTRVTSYYDWSDIHESYRPMADRIFPVVSETSLRATLGILARTVAPRRGRPGA